MGRQLGHVSQAPVPCSVAQSLGTNLGTPLLSPWTSSDRDAVHVEEIVTLTLWLIEVSRGFLSASHCLLSEREQASESFIGQH